MVKRLIYSLLAFGGMIPAVVTAQVTELTQPEENLVDEIELVNYTDLNERIAQLESQIATFNARSQSYSNVSHSKTYSRSTCNNYCCTNDAGWSLGVDCVFAKPHFSDGVENGDPTYDFSLAPRIILAHKDECGVGCRARYWWYEDDSSIASGNGDADAGLQTEFRMDVVDLEITKDLCWGRVKPTVFAGLRYMDHEHAEIQNDNDVAKVNGWGPAIGIDTLTPVGCNCNFVGNVRYAALFGEAKSDGDQMEDLGFNSIEAQLGFQWQRCTKYGTMRYHTLVEAQNWESAFTETDTINNDPDDDIVMLGLVFGIEFLR